jgi:hypothetical protein
MRLSASTFMFASALVGLVACGPGEQVQVPFDSGDISFTIDTPMIAGPNTVQQEISLNLDEAFGAAGANREKITAVTFEPMVFSADSGKTFDLFESFTVQFFSDANDMSSVMTMTPEKGKNSLEGTPASENNLSVYFKEAVMFLVIDANLTAGDTLPFTFTTRLKGNLSAGKK